MHALHRELVNKLKSTSKLYKESFDKNKYLGEAVRGMDSSIDKLKLAKVELDSKLYFEKERIEMLTAELSTKTQL